jgi:hypothetical protein
MACRKLAVLLVAAGLACAAVACSGDDGNAQLRSRLDADSGKVSSAVPFSSVAPPPSTVDPTVATSPVPPEFAAPLAALDEYWKMLKRIGANPDPDDPELAQVTTGQLQKMLQDVYVGYRNSQQVEQWDGVPSDVVFRVDSATIAVAAFSACFHDGVTIHDSHSGKVLNSNVVTSFIQGKIIYISGSWKLSESGSKSKTPGVVPCDSVGY